jgi:hypothetical protein
VLAINPTSYQESLLLEEDEEDRSRIPWKPIPVFSKYLYIFNTMYNFST